MADDETLDEMDGQGDIGGGGGRRTPSGRGRAGRKGGSREARISARVAHHRGKGAKAAAGIGGTLVVILLIVARVGLRVNRRVQADRAEAQANVIVDALSNSEVEGDCPDDISVDDLRWDVDTETSSTCTFHFEADVTNLNEDQMHDVSVRIDLLDGGGKQLAKSTGTLSSIPCGDAKHLRTSRFTISKDTAARLKRYRIIVQAD